MNEAVCMVCVIHNQYSILFILTLINIVTSCYAATAFLLLPGCIALYICCYIVYG